MNNTNKKHNLTNKKQTKTKAKEAVFLTSLIVTHSSIWLRFSTQFM